MNILLIIFFLSFIGLIKSIADLFTLIAPDELDDDDNEDEK